MRRVHTLFCPRGRKYRRFARKGKGELLRGYKMLGQHVCQCYTLIPLISFSYKSDPCDLLLSRICRIRGVQIIVHA